MFYNSTRWLDDQCKCGCPASTQKKCEDNKKFNEATCSCECKCSIPKTIPPGKKWVVFFDLL